MPYRNNDRRSSSSSARSGNRKSGAKFGKGDDKFIMMQVGKQFLDEGDYGWKTRILFGQEESEYNWCVRDKSGVSYWFGRKLGLQLLFRAIEAGRSLGTSSFFERDGEYSGNPRINVKGIATEKELALAKRNAEQEAWLDVEDESEEDEEEEEDERPARKASARKVDRRMETARKASKSQPKREYPDLDDSDLDADEEDESEETEVDTDADSYDDIPY